MVKRNAVALLLAWVAVWPLVQRGLVARFAIDPWKLGGFAMYATPSLPLLVALQVPRDGQLVLLDESTLPPPTRAALRRFRVERLALGRLRSPDDAARAVLEARPDLPAVVVLVQHTTLDPRSARTRAETERHSYDRSMLFDE
jgi:hypothetical protein